MVESFNSCAADSTWTLSSLPDCISLEEVGLGLFPLGLIPVFVIVLLKVLAAFCAADKTLEKKPAPGVGGTSFSGVGVKGADMKLESLLGPMLVAEPDLALLCDIMLPDGDTTTLGFETGRFLGLD
jgi:hypothetical protein